jgi:SAM-dependent methyltransferase
MQTTWWVLVMMETRSSLQSAFDIICHQLPRGNIRIYEAGGGSMSCLPLDTWQAKHITAVDIDAVQLQNNSYADTKILGDIQKYRFPEGSFDLIVCYNVVEHLAAPDRALALFFDALAPGGLLFIGAPNPNSLSGIVTKRTPHWLHVAYYRWIRGKKDAGQAGKMPFRTVYHPIVSPDKLAAFCEELGFEVVYLKEYEALHIQILLAQRPLFGRMLNAAIGILSAFAADKNKLRNGDFHAILRKPDTRPVP